MNKGIYISKVLSYIKLMGLSIKDLSEKTGIKTSTLYYAKQKKSCTDELYNCLTHFLEENYSNEYENIKSIISSDL